MSRSGEDIARDFVVLFGRGEHFDRERGNLRLLSFADPANKIIRHIEHRGAEKSRSQPRPFAVPVKVVNECFECAQANYKAAPLVAKDMAPTADFRGSTVDGSPEHTRTRPAQ